MAELYTYAVTRIHAKEASLLTKQNLEALLSAKTYDDAIRMLRDYGIDGGNSNDYGEILTAENDKLWALIDELKIDKDKLAVFFCKKDFHNLKASIKATLTGAKPNRIYLKGGSIPPEEIQKAVEEKDFSSLPENMRKTAQMAMTALIQTGDGQLCDMIIDRSALNAIRKAGKNSGDKFLEEYAEIAVALSNIKIAVRGNALLKSADFIKEAMAECSSLDIDSLSASASKSREDMLKFISQTDYKGAAEALNISYSEFEKWCDNLIMDKISSQKANPFTIAPIGAYILAKENEISALRIVLSGKANGLDEEFIRERLREVYV